MPFLVLARPSSAPVAAGGVLALAGLLLRGWAAGTVRKDAELATTGPYGHLRHPLYVGSFLIGLGMGIGGGHWVWPLLVAAYFALAYRRTVVEEGARLEGLFGVRYREYAAHVPALLPRLSPFRAAAAEAEVGEARGKSPAAAAVGRVGFTWARYLRNREWEALLGTAAAFALLAVRQRWLGWP